MVQESRLSELPAGKEKKSARRRVENIAVPEGPKAIQLALVEGVT